MQVTEQSLLFEKNAPIQTLSAPTARAHQEFYANGFTLLQNLVDSTEARLALDAFIASIDKTHSPTLGLFENRIQLAKVDRIPSPHCQDAVEINNVSLHFDMGLPLLPKEPETTVYLLTCLYFPANEAPSSTKTRLFDTRGLFAHLGGEARPHVARSIIQYVERYGDGWEQFNSGRLACLGRLIEAVAGKPELLHMRDHRIAEWFNKDGQGQQQEGLEVEAKFFEAYGIPLPRFEKRVHLQPGDLLIIDNTRVAHGRDGRRKAGEIFQYLYGVETALPAEIDQMRENAVDELLKS